MSRSRTKRIRKLFLLGTLIGVFALVVFKTTKKYPDFLSSVSLSGNTAALLAIEHFTVKEKHRGAHVFGYLDSTNLNQIKDQNYNWITMVSYGDQKDYNSKRMVYFRGDSSEMMKRDSIWSSQIDLAHQPGFKVFLKPHVWISSPTDNTWRADIFPENEENWAIWQQDYREFILLYANIAQKNNVELFSIGVEFSRLSKEKPEFWRSLIKEVRAIYDGKLTYSANWNQEFQDIEFWNELDFIGIQAYFPLVKNESPSLLQLEKGWSKHVKEIEKVYIRDKKPVLFTEMGYKSTSDSAIRPWEWLEDPDLDPKTLSLETQANCYRVFFDAIWPKSWMAGIHIWQLRSRNLHKSRLTNMDFTPAGKPAQSVISAGFKPNTNQ